MKNRFIIAFSLWMAGMFIATTASAQTYVQVEGIEYQIFSGKNSATVCNLLESCPEEVALPDSVERSGKKYCVTEIGNDVFSGRWSLKRVILPKGLIAIGDKAFYGCTGLIAVDLPKSVQSIGYKAFANCSSLVDVWARPIIIPYNTSIFAEINKACVLHYPKESEQWYEPFRGDFAEMIPFVEGYTGYNFEPSTKDVLDSYQNLQDITVHFEGIEGIAASKKASTLIARLWIGDEVVAESVKITEDVPEPEEGGELSPEKTEDGAENVAGVADADNGEAAGGDGSEQESTDDAPENIVFGEKQLSIHFENLPEDLFVSTEPDVIKQVRLTIEGTVMIDDCFFDLSLGTSAEDSATWTVPAIYRPYAYPLDHRCIQMTPAGNAPLESYKQLQNVALAFDGFEQVALDTENGEILTAKLCRNGEVLYEMQPDNMKCEGNVLTIQVPIKEADVVVGADDAAEDWQFSLLVDGHILLDDVRYVLSFVEQCEPSDDAMPQYEASVQWTAAALHTPEPTSVEVSPVQVATYKDLTTITVKLGGIVAMQLDEKAENPYTAKLLLGENGRTDGTLAVEDGVLVCTFPEIDERDFSLISSDPEATLAVALQIDAPLLLRTAELEEYYPYQLRISPEENPKKWDVPVKVYPNPIVEVSTPLAETPQTYLDLRKICLTLGGFSTLSLDGFAEGCIMRADSTEAVYRFDAGKVSTDGMQMWLDLSDLPATSVYTMFWEEKSTVTLSLHFTADVLLDGMPYTLVVDGKNHNAEWVVEPIVIRELPAPVLSYSYGQLLMSTGVEGTVYHYTIRCNDHRASGNVAVEKTGTIGKAQADIRQTYTIEVYATCENYNDSETVTYTLDFNGEHPEVFQGESTDGVLTFSPKRRRNR